MKKYNLELADGEGTLTFTYDPENEMMRVRVESVRDTFYEYPMMPEEVGDLLEWLWTLPMPREALPVDATPEQQREAMTKARKPQLTADQKKAVAEWKAGAGTHRWGA